MNKEIWSKILHIAITILTAIATTFGGNLVHGQLADRSTKKEGYAATAYPLFRRCVVAEKRNPQPATFIKKKKGIYHRHPIFINLKSNTMKNTVQK